MKTRLTPAILIPLLTACNGTSSVQVFADNEAPDVGGPAARVAARAT